MTVLKQSDIDILSGSVNRRVRMDDMEDAEVKRLFRIIRDFDDSTESGNYPPGSMFAFWFDNMRAMSGWYVGVKRPISYLAALIRAGKPHYRVNEFTDDISLTYWDRWHERKRLNFERKQNSHKGGDSHVVGI
jgi:hypothetical protein